MQTKDPHNTRSQDVTLIMWKLKHGPAPIYISTLFNAKNTRHNLRKNDFELPKFETVRYIRHYKIHGASHLVQATQKTKNCRKSSFIQEKYWESRTIQTRELIRTYSRHSHNPTVEKSCVCNKF